MLSVALQGLRGRKGPFAGAFIALVIASALVMACGTLMQAGLGSEAPVERYAAAPIVIAGEQKAVVDAGTDSEDSIPLYERARVHASLASRLAAIHGVRAAVADISIPASVKGPQGHVDGPGGHPTAVHPWATAALTPYVLDQGRAPRAAGELVVDSGIARRGGLHVGQRVVLESNGPDRVLTLVGVARSRAEVTRQGALFVTGPVAAQLSGVAGRVDAIGILPARGADRDALVKDLRHAVAGRARVVTGSGRGDVEHVENAEAKEAVTAISGTFGGLALLIAMFVVGSTIGLSVLQRQREVALLRAVAATPRQVRRMIRWETVVVGLVASAVGVVPGALFAGALGHALSARGIAPEDMEVTFGVVPAVIAIGSTVLTALIAVAAAGRRAARVRPTQALQESAGGGRLIGVPRALVGIVAVGGGVALLGVTAGGTDAQSGADLAFGASAAFVVGVAALGPVLMRIASGLAGAVLSRSGSTSAFLAVSNMRQSPRRFASAMTPLVLTVAISCTLLFSGTTREHETMKQGRERVTADVVLQSDGVGIPRSAVADARHVPGVARAVGIAQTNLGPGLGSKYKVVPAVVVDPQGADRVLDLDVRSGSLSSMRNDEIALSKTQAESAHASAGDVVSVTLGDGARTHARVAAVYERGLGFGDVVIPAAMAAGHLTSPLLSTVLIRVAPGASPSAVAQRLRSLERRYGGLSVGDRSDLDARVDASREADNWLFRILAGILFAFTAVAVVNTLMMIALHRKRELALLRLVGGTRRQLLGMSRWEGSLTVALGLGIGGGIALITLMPTANVLSGSSIPYAPIGLLALVLGSSAAIGLFATQVSTRIALRPRPVDGIGLRD